MLTSPDDEEEGGSAAPSDKEQGGGGGGVRSWAAYYFSYSRGEGKVGGGGGFVARLAEFLGAEQGQDEEWWEVGWFESMVFVCGWMGLWVP